MLRVELIAVNEIIRTTAAGELEFDQVESIFGKIAAATEASEQHVVLIDARQSSAKLNTTHIWSLAQELHLYGSTFRKKSALLVNPGEIDLAKLFELFARSQGFTVNAFSDFENAINWLLGSNDKD